MRIVSASILHYVPTAQDIVVKVYSNKDIELKQKGERRTTEITKESRA